MHENFSLVRGERGDNIHKYPLNKLVDMNGSQLDSTTFYCDKHNMIGIIAIERIIVSCGLYLRLGCTERVPVPSRK